MKKFVIRSVVSFLLIFVFVSGVSYFFYNKIADGYISQEIADAVYVNSMSTRDILNAQFKVVNKSFKRYYIGKEDKDLQSLNEGLNEFGEFEDLDAEFGILDKDTLTVANNVVYHAKEKNDDLLFLTDFLGKEIYFLNFHELFEEEFKENDVRILFNLDYGNNEVEKNKVGIISADKFLGQIVKGDREYIPDTFIINKNGFINYKTLLSGGHIFWDYIRANANENDVKELIDFVNNTNQMDSEHKDLFISNDFKFQKNDSYIVYLPLNIVSEAKDDFYIITTFYDESLVNLRENLVIPLIVLFVVLCVILLVGITLLYIAALKKNSDIEASKLAMYYAKPYILQINKKGKIVYKNQSFKKLGIDWKKYTNVYFFDIIGDDIDILGSIKKRKTITLQMTNETGFTYTFYFVPAKMGLGMYLLGQEVTQKYNEVAGLIHEVTYDNLTGLPNKKILLQDLKEHLKYINHEKNDDKNIINSTFIIFSIQRLDRLTNIFGSLTIDKLIIEFMNIVKEQMGEDEKLYRLDKDLFAILFEKVEKYDDVIEWINKLMTVLKKPLSIDENQLMVLIKTGIFNIELDLYEQLDENNVYEYAEIAYNHANGLSSIDYMVYNISLGRLVKKEQLMEEDLKKAIENNEFVVYVQPQYDTDKNRIVGFEALTRWNNPKYLTDSPQHFIEMAEKNNMIVPIGRIITEDAFKIAKDLESYNVEISINVSPAQMMQDGFVSQFINICKKYEVNPEMIALEITETFLVQNFKLVNEKLGVLKKYGFKIHLDDFGTGYSSLLYLKDLPIDAIKIDKEFTKYVNTDKATRTIVSKVISLATSLDLTIIAEGVEDEKQSIFLNKNGCTIIQGWLIGKAMPIDSALKLLKEYNVTKTKGLDIDTKSKKTRAKKAKEKEDLEKKKQEIEEQQKLQNETLEEVKEEVVVEEIANKEDDQAILDEMVVATDEEIKETLEDAKKKKATAKKTKSTKTSKAKQTKPKKETKTTKKKTSKED